MFDELLAANAEYADSFEHGDLAATPRRGLCVVTCMDARIDPLRVLGLPPGDAHVLRNAGGRVSDDVIRSLVVSTRLMGVTSVAVMHHTQCGMANISGQNVKELLSDVAEEHLETFDLLAIDDQEQALRTDVAAVAHSPLLPPVDVAGFVYDVATGVVTRVV